MYHAERSHVFRMLPCFHASFATKLTYVWRKTAWEKVQRREKRRGTTERVGFEAPRCPGGRVACALCSTVPRAPGAGYSLITAYMRPQMAKTDEPSWEPSRKSSVGKCQNGVDRLEVRPTSRSLRGSTLLGEKTERVPKIFHQVFAARQASCKADRRNVERRCEEV
jgi:hypothetical protein